MERKIIFLDCDGTLFDAPRGMLKASDKTRYAIKELLNNGHLVFIASGRCKCLMPKDVLDLKPSGFITTNGSYAYMNDEIIYNRPLKDESVKLVIDYCEKHNAIYFLEAQDLIYTKDCHNDLFIDFVDTWGVNRNIFTDIKGNYTYHLMMSAFKSEEECNEFVNQLSSKLDIRRQYGYTSFDVAEYDVNKGTGVRKVLEYLNIDKSNAYAFGDGLNDLEMIEAVGESYAMENGHPKLKALSKNIAPDVLDDGFYEVMVWEGLIKPLK